MTPEEVEAAVARVMDVLAPKSGSDGTRHPLFEWGHEVTPTEEEVRDLARQVVLATLAAPKKD